MVPHMRTLVLLLIPILLVAGCLQTPPARPNDSQTGNPEPREQSGGSPDTPAWSVNDHWVLRTFREGQHEDEVQVRDHFVQAIDILRSNDADMDAFRVVSQQDNRTTWYRMSDLALMKEQTVAEDGLVETIYETPCAWYQWPLSVGAGWDGDCVRVRDGEPSKLTFNATVEAQEQVDVPSGNFSTFRIHYTGTDDGKPIDRTDYFAPDICFAARIKHTTADGTFIEELLTHQCTNGG